MTRAIALAFASVLVAGIADADVQEIAPGTGEQDAVVIDSGANGICETAAAVGDIQLGTIGAGSPNRTAVRCGSNKIVETIAAGDDVQLVAFGAACKNTNTPVVDTGANGISDTTAAGDDTQVIAVGVAPPNAPCVIAGADGVAQTAVVSGDDDLELPTGTAEPNTAVVRCGPNLVADTTANNTGVGGDDVQLVPAGDPCSENAVVVDSGADGIATTRAEGPDLRIGAFRPVRLTIPKGKASGSKTIKFTIANTEFGASAPATRSYRLAVAAGSCGGGVVTQVDADSVTPGLQATGSVAKGGEAKATVVATMRLQNVTTTASNNPFRCSFDVSVVALDTDPEVDDGANEEGNTATVTLEVADRNDY